MSNRFKVSDCGKYVDDTFSEDMLDPATCCEMLNILLARVHNLELESLERIKELDALEAAVEVLKGNYGD